MRLSRPTIIVVGFLALHASLGYWNPVGMWGVDLLAYCPGWVQVFFVVLSTLLLIPVVRQRLIDRTPGFLPALDPWRSSRSFYLFAVLLIITGSFAFIGLRSATHLLGDGYLYLRELDDAVWQAHPRADHAPLSFWIIRVLHQFGRPIWHSSETTYRIYSYISGVFYLFLSLPVARILGRNSAERTLIFGFLLTPGFLQLFCGYVENYALLFPGILLYLLLGFQALRGELPIWVSALFLGILIPLHFAVVSLVPSLLILAMLRSGSESGSGAFGAARWKTALGNAVYLSLAFTVTLVILIFVGFNPLTYLGSPKTSHLLPLFAEPGFTQPYRIFSLAHLLDLLNHYFLVASSAMIALFLLRRGRSSRNPDRTFLLTATFFPVLFTFLANPEIGAFRDWDVFAFPALPLTLWSGVALAGQIRERVCLSHTGILICGAAALHSLVWIGVNTDATSAELRFAEIMKRSQLSVHARSYGWETLGNYYSFRNKTERAVEAYKQAIEATPGNLRHWVNIGGTYVKQGKLKDAGEALRLAVTLDSTRADTWYHLSRVLRISGDLEGARRAVRKAIDLNSSNPGYWAEYSDLGSVYHVRGDIDQALFIYQESLRFRPNSVATHINIGIIHYSQEHYLDAASSFQRAIQLSPVDAEAYLGLAQAYERLQRFGEAIQAYRIVLSFDPDNETARSNLRDLLQRKSDEESER